MNEERCPKCGRYKYFSILCLVNRGPIRKKDFEAQFRDIRKFEDLTPEEQKVQGEAIGEFVKNLEVYMEWRRENGPLKTRGEMDV